MLRDWSIFDSQYRTTAKQASNRSAVTSLELWRVNRRRLTSRSIPATGQLNRLPIEILVKRWRKGDIFEIVWAMGALGAEVSFEQARDK